MMKIKEATGVRTVLYQRTSKIEEKTISERRAWKYQYCPFIIETVVEVELWIVAGLFLSDHQTAMNPQLLESLVFLHDNGRFWDDKIV